MKPKHNCYQPPLPRELIKALYHEAKSRRKPMTRLLADMVRDALRDTHGMSVARKELEQTASLEAA